MPGPLEILGVVIVIAAFALKPNDPNDRPIRF